MEIQRIDEKPPSDFFFFFSSSTERERLIGARVCGGEGEEWGIRPEWGGVKKEQVGDIGSSSAVIRVHFDKFFMSSLSRKAAVALGEQAIIVAHADL